MQTVSTPSDAGMATTMPTPAPGSFPAPVTSDSNGFIHHPEDFPLRYRRRSRLPWRHRAPRPAQGTVGLSFHCTEYLPAGSLLDVEIPLRGRVQRFLATVILVREQVTGFEIGLGFPSADDAARARIVERICHTESYLKARRARAN